MRSNSPLCIASVPPMNHSRRRFASVRYRHTVSTGASSIRSSRIVSGVGRVIGVALCIVSVILLLLMFAGFDRGFEPVETNGPEFLPLTEPLLGFRERP